MWVDPWVGKIPWRRAWQPTPVFLLENPMDRGAWWAAVHMVAESQTQLKWPGTQASTLSCNPVSGPVLGLYMHLTI